MPAIANNRKAFFDYEILEKLEAGLVLTGAEVKAAKKGSVDMKGSFVVIRGDEAWLTNMHIGHYAPAGSMDGYEPTRTRKLLLHKKEIAYLKGKHEADRLTVVPTSIFTHHNRVKVEIALARGKRKFEKRETIKKRDLERELKDYR